MTIVSSHQVSDDHPLHSFLLPSCVVVDRVLVNPALETTIPTTSKRATTTTTRHYTRDIYCPSLCLLLSVCLIEPERCGYSFLPNKKEGKKERKKCSSLYNSHQSEDTVMAPAGSIARRLFSRQRCLLILFFLAIFLFSLLFVVCIKRCAIRRYHHPILFAISMRHLSPLGSFESRSSRFSSG